MKKSAQDGKSAQRALAVYSLLSSEYRYPGTALNFSNSWQILAATILSAQCTDKRVNIITETLFSEYPDVEDYASMNPGHLEELIRSCGFFRSKAANIIGAARCIMSDFEGRVPDKMKDILRLPGVARKTANVVLGNAYGTVEGIAVDTHVKRLSGRIGLTGEKDPVKIEKDLMSILPRDKWFNITYLLIEHGRSVCKAQAPLCSGCVLAGICPKNGVEKSR